MPTSRSGSTSPLSAHRAVVLVIDVQERLCAAMPPAVADAVIRNTSTLAATACRIPSAPFGGGAWVSTRANSVGS